jgi:hypothetical protein
LCYPKLNCSTNGAIRKVCVRVGYIEIDGDASARSTRVTSRHSQLVPFTALASDLEALLPLFSNSSRSEANKRCVRSALGCKCSISVTQENDHKSYTVSKEVFFFFGETRGERGAGEWSYEKIRVPLCNTISAALPTSSEPSAHRPTPFGVVGSGERKF